MVLVFFNDPEAPLKCAMEIAAALKERRDIPVRMGIHSGPVHRVVDVNEAANAAGAGIDIAQRVMDCGDAGHILLSRRVAYDLAPSPRWNAHLFELGECEVKHGQKLSLVNFYTPDIGNPEVPRKIALSRAQAARREKEILGLPRPVAVGVGIVLFLLLLAGGYLARRHFVSTSSTPAVESAEDKSIAVLPFADLSEAKDQEYFCDGLSEELLDALAKVEGLRVVARTSSFSFKGRNIDATEMGRKLKVGALLAGSLRRDGNRIRVNAQLVNARDGSQIWSHKFERELQGVFAVQDEITRAIVDKLKIRLAVGPRSHGSKNTDAYDLYLKGLYFSNKSSEEDLRIGLAFFEQALAKDPKLGRAWTGIAKIWVWLSDAYIRPLEAMPRAESAARQAIALDDKDAEAHAYLSEGRRILSYDLKGEETELKKALQIDPNSAVAHLFMALLRTAQGDFEAGLAEMRTAVQLDPLSPIVGNWEVSAYLANGRLDDAFTAAKRTMEIDPDYIYFEPNLAMVYREQGKLKEALEIYQRLEKSRKQPTAGLAITYARLGRKEEAKRVLSQLVEIANTRYFPGEQIASVYAALGEHDAAFRWIERAITEHSGPIHVLGFAPEFKPLRADPRFPDVLRRIGLDPVKLRIEKQ